MTVVEEELFLRVPYVLFRLFYLKMTIDAHDYYRVMVRFLTALAFLFVLMVYTSYHPATLQPSLSSQSVGILKK